LTTLLLSGLALVLFAAGNDGDNGASTVGPPATNKNGICVGASMSTTDSFRAIMGPNVDGKYYSEQFVAGFSSQGPVADGRLKPDITAPGLPLLLYPLPSSLAGPAVW
jgi:subtilisin family serine protease